MKILVIGNFPFDRWSGGCIVANYLIREYKNNGHKVSILSFSQLNNEKKGKTLWGDDVINYKTFSGKILTIFREFLDVYNPKTIFNLRREIKKIRPDLIHIHNLHADISAYSVKLIHKMKIPVIVTLHEFWAICPRFNLADNNWQICNIFKKQCSNCKKLGHPYEIYFPFRNYLIKKYTSLADYIIMPSKFAAQQFVKAGYPIKKVESIYNGVDLERFKPLPKVSENKKIKILYVGRTSIKKGIIYLLEAINKLYQEKYSVELKIITKPKGIETLIKDLTFVKIVKEMHIDKLPKHYQEADIFVQPSIIPESFGLTIAEAMACGLPTVVSNIGALPEVAGNSGLVIAPADVEALSKAIEKLVSSSPLRKELGQKARQRAIELFDWHKIGGEYLNYIKNLCQR